MTAESDRETTHGDVPAGSGLTQIYVGGDAGNIVVQTAVTEFEDALTRAESLLRQVDNNRLIAATVRLAQLVIPVGTLLATWIIESAADVETVYVVGSLAAVALTNILFVVSSRNLLLSALTAQINRDQEAMIETVNALREQLSSVAAESEWSRSAYRLNRLRIERFPL